MEARARAGPKHFCSASFNVYAPLHITLKHSGHEKKKEVDSAPPEGCALRGRLVGLVEGPALGSRLWLAGLWWRRDAFAAKLRTVNSATLLLPH